MATKRHQHHELIAARYGESVLKSIDFSTMRDPQGNAYFFSVGADGKTKVDHYNVHEQQRSSFARLTALAQREVDRLNPTIKEEKNGKA